MAEAAVVGKMFGAWAAGQVKTEEQWLAYNHADSTIEHVGDVISHPRFFKMLRGYSGFQHWTALNDSTDLKMEPHVVQGKEGEAMIVFENIKATNKVTGKAADTEVAIYLYKFREGKIASTKIFGITSQACEVY